MVHDPVEQGHDKYNSFLSSMFILKGDASSTEILILLLYFNSSSVGFTYCYRLEHKLFAVQIKNVYGDSLVLLLQRSCFQTLSWS